MKVRKSKVLSAMLSVMLTMAMMVALPAKAYAAITFGYNYMLETIGTSSATDADFDIFVDGDEDTGTFAGTFTFVSDGSYASVSINEGWFGQSLTIYNDDHSDYGTIIIPDRPSAPSLTSTDASSDTAEDGTISGFDDTLEFMQIRELGETTWVPVNFAEVVDGTLSGFAAGTYEVRYAPLNGDPYGPRFASLPATVTVGVLAEHVCMNVDTDTYYTTLIAAVAEAADGETIIVLTNINEDSSISIAVSDLTIDMDGYNVALNTGGLEVDGDYSATVINGGNLSGSGFFAGTAGSLSITAETVTAGAVSVYEGASMGIFANTLTTFYIEVDDATLEIEANVETTSGVLAENGAIVTITGNLSSTSSEYAAISAFDDGTEVTLVGNIESGYDGVYAQDGAYVFVQGNITTSTVWSYAAYAFDATIEIEGNIQAYSIGVFAYSDSADSEIAVTGNIVAGLDAVWTLGEDTAVYVDGNVTGACYGVWATDGFVYISGNVTSLNIDYTEGDEFKPSAGVRSDGAAGVVVDGKIIADTYILFYNEDTGEYIPVTAADYDATSSLPGYLQYSGGVPLSWVWVKSTIPGDGTPATGDGAVVAVPVALASALMAFVALGRRRSLMTAA